MLAKQLIVVTMGCMVWDIQADIEVGQLLSPHSVSSISIPGVRRRTNSSLTLWAKTEGSGGPQVGEVLVGGDDGGVLHFSTSLDSHLNTWSLVLGDKKGHGRTLCQDQEKTENANDGDDNDDEVDLTVAVINNSPTTQEVLLTVLENKQFQLELYSNVRVDLVGTSAQVFMFSPSQKDLDDDITYLITVENSGGCIYVGISPTGCPWNDDIRTVRNNPIWARVLSIGYFPLEARKFHSSFLLILLPSLDSCVSTTAQLINTTRQVNLTIKPSPTDYQTPIFIAMTFLVVPALFSFTFLSLFWRKKYHDHQITHPTQEIEDDIDQSSRDQPDEAIVVKKDDKKTIYLPELMTKYSESEWHRRLRSSVYLYVVPLLAIFYIVPSSQLVYLNRIGNSGEACFFNYGCARQWWIFDSFNHIFSNVGYILLGLVFLLLVWVKSIYFPEDQFTGDNMKMTGLPQQYAIFYSMGLAMVSQGVLSAIFHVCPSNLSLQFDTTMMYLLMTLVAVKIWQFRHPDTTSNAFLCMYAFSVAVILEAVSIYVASNITYRVVFTVTFACVYVATIFYLGANFYFNRAIVKSRYLGKNITRLRRKLAEPGLLAHKLRFLTCFAFVLINIGLFIYVMVSLSSRGKSLSTPFILIFGGNMFVYLTYYAARKIIDILQRDVIAHNKAMVVTSSEKEDPQSVGWLTWTGRLLQVDICEDEGRKTVEDSPEEEIEENQCQMNLVRWLSFILFGSSIFVFLIAMVFYSNKHQSRNLTPPESRDRNETCKFMDFFDNHDLWHFFSSLGLFFAFIALLTIDDDLLYVKRNDIKVF